MVSACERKAVAVLQLDICKFTTMSQTMHPLDIAAMLHHIYSAFDRDVRGRGLHKMDTVGDAYIVAGWLPEKAVWNSTGCDVETSNEARAVCEQLLHVAKRMLKTLDSYRVETNQDVRCRIGIATGEVIAGVLGQLQPRYSTLPFVSEIYHSTVL